MISPHHDGWAALNSAELALENKGDEIARELAEAREKTEIAVARANLLIQQRAATQTEFTRITAELERLREILTRRTEADRPHQADAHPTQPTEARSAP